MSKLLLLSSYFYPEPTGIGPLAMDLCRCLSAAGHCVSVATHFPMMPAWRVYDGYRGRLFARERNAACTVLRTWTYVPRPHPQELMKTWKRIAFDCGAFLSTLRAGLTLPPQDLIIAICPPLQTGAGALALKKMWGARVLFWIQDIVPDAAVEVGMMKDSAALLAARRLESFVYRGVDRIAVISEPFRANLLRKCVTPGKVSVIENWSGPDGEAVPAGDDPGIPEEAFVVMHTGSIAAKQHLENVIDAASRIAESERVYLVVTGDGNRRAAVQSYARPRLGERAMFLGTIEAAAFQALLHRADLFVLNQAANVRESVAPSKLLKYHAAGRPVVAAVHRDSEAARIVRDSGGGLVVPPEDPDALARAMLELRADPARRMRMGEAGAEYARQHFSRTNSLNRFAALVDAMLTPQAAQRAQALQS